MAKEEGEIIELPFALWDLERLFGEWNGFNEGIEWREIIKGERYHELMVGNC